MVCQNDAIAPLMNKLEVHVKRKIVESQGGVPTFFDNALLTGLRELRELSNGPTDFRTENEPPRNKLAPERARVLLRHWWFATRSRLVDFATRSAESESWESLPWEATPHQLWASQGVDECLTWRGLPLFKSVYDLAMYPMLMWEQRPLTVIELGSGTGASALWLADLMRLQGTDSRVFSVDIRKPDVQDGSISFLEGDCREIEEVLPYSTLAYLGHPWLVIEDVHVNTLGILRHFAGVLRKDDYLVIEDSRSKQSELACFAKEYGADFKVDTRYTDFFGRNTTCSADSIFVKQ
jgi:cephalosporin hydroxylase